MKIKAVILDYGGTLAEGKPHYKEYNKALLAYIRSLGYHINLKDIQSAINTTLRNLNKVRAKGKEQTFEEVYKLFLRKLKILEDEKILNDLHGIFKTHYISNYFACTGEVLKELSDRYKVALISNTMSDLPHTKLDEAGFSKYFDLIICSSDLGIRKPNPEIFKYVLEKLGVYAEETVHVGDSVEADMEGATGVGITGIWIKTPGEHQWHGYAIGTICELPNFLKKISLSIS
jgi:putative hydrolase of the HAD superfamily